MLFPSTIQVDAIKNNSALSLENTVFVTAICIHLVRYIHTQCPQPMSIKTHPVLSPLFASVNFLTTTHPFLDRFVASCFSKTISQPSVKMLSHCLDYIIDHVFISRTTTNPLTPFAHFLKQFKNKELLHPLFNTGVRGIESWSSHGRL